MTSASTLPHQPRATGIPANLYRLLSLVIALGVAAQFLLAGAGAFGATGWDAHRTLGEGLLGAAAVLLVVAIARHGGRRLPAGLVALLALQFLLGSLGGDHHWFGAVHGLAALAVAAVAGANARRATHSSR